jgi:hypothetical protein
MIAAVILHNCLEVAAGIAYSTAPPPYMGHAPIFLPPITMNDQKDQKNANTIAEEAINKKRHHNNLEL